MQSLQDEANLVSTSSSAPCLVLLDHVARCSVEKENNFYSSDSDFDDEEPKKFHIQIRPVASSNRSSSAATEKELKATVGSLTLPPNRTLRQKVKHLFLFLFLLSEPGEIENAAVHI